MTKRPARLLVIVCCLVVFLLATPADASRDLSDSLAPTIAGPVAGSADLDRSPPVRPALPLFSAADIVALSYDYDGPDQLLSLTAGRSSVGHHVFQGLWTDPVTGIAYARNRWYDARTASWLSEDPMGAVDSPNLYAFVGWGPHVGRDPMGLAVYFFDGTANNPGQENPTNVFRLFENTREAAFYSTGIGGDQPTGVKIFNDLLTAYFKFSGTGFEKKAEMMYLRVVEQYNRGDTDISIVGFSRGAATARHLANLISERGIPDLSSVKIEKSGGTTRIVVGKYLNKKPAIKFLGLFDTVASIGWPGDESNPGMRLGIPNSVMRVRHATAASEKRRGFPLNSVIDPSYPGDPRIIEQPFRGAHSDIGGGYSDDNCASEIPLVWMWGQMIDAGVSMNRIPGNLPSNCKPIMYHDSREYSLYRFIDLPLDFWIRENQREVFPSDNEPYFQMAPSH